MKFRLWFATLLATTALAFAADVQKTPPTPATQPGAAAQKISPADAAKLVADGKAVLVDVREPKEWAETGVAAPAVLLAKSDFDGPQKDWKPFLEKNEDKEIILYCRSGGRAGTVAAALAAKGLKVANAGGLKDWAAAGLPVRLLEPKK